MDDLISKASVCEVLADIYPTDGEKVVAVKEIDKAYEAILHLPSAQPLTAYVISDEDGNIKCSNCGSFECWGNYCMNCGADMRGNGKAKRGDSE